MFPGPLQHSLAGKGLKKKLWSLQTINIRDFSHLKHQKVDDVSFGGGAGLIIRPDIIHKALEYAVSLHTNPTIIYLSPKGESLNHSHIKKWTQNKSKEIIFLCGRYEGIDERVIEYWKQKKNLIEISIGDYILSGGEIAAMTIIDACLRHVPGILEQKETLKEESFEVELLEYPQYTKPREWKGKTVPDILLTGHHQAIKDWRKEMSEAVTKSRRPDLWEKYKRKT